MHDLPMSPTVRLLRALWWLAGIACGFPARPSEELQLTTSLSVPPAGFPETWPLFFGLKGLRSPEVPDEYPK